VKYGPPQKQHWSFLQGIVKNPIAKAAIGTVIAEGDAVVKKFAEFNGAEFNKHRTSKSF
jgi:hypothetical protein